MCLFGNKPCFLPRKPLPPRPIAHPTSFENPTFQAFIKRKSSHLDETSRPPKRACNPACISLGLQVLVFRSVRAFSFSEKRNSKSHGLSRPHAQKPYGAGKNTEPDDFLPTFGYTDNSFVANQCCAGRISFWVRRLRPLEVLSRGASRPLHASNPRRGRRQIQSTLVLFSQRQCHQNIKQITATHKSESSVVLHLHLVVFCIGVLEVLAFALRYHYTARQVAPDCPNGYTRTSNSPSFCASQAPTCAPYRV